MSTIPQIIPAAWRLPLLTLALTLSLLVVMMAETAGTMIALWQAETTFNHCFLVLPITLSLIWVQREQLAALIPREERLALLPLAVFGFLWLIGRAGQVHLFEHLALVGMIISVIIALLGREVAKAIAFPLGFLFFLVPFGDVFMLGLQMLTADFSVALLRLANVPVLRAGAMIDTPSGLFDVAKACDGVRFLIANIMIGVLFSHLALVKRWKWALFMIIAVALPIIASALRAFGSILIAYITDHVYAVGAGHFVSDWIFFAAMMLAFLTIGNAIADWPSSAHESVGQRQSSPVPKSWHPAMAIPSAFLVVAAPLYAANVLNDGPFDINIRPELMIEPTLALDLGPKCEARHEPASGWRPSFIRADMIQSLKVDCGGAPIDLTFAYYAHERDGAGLVQHGNRLADGENWTRISASWHRHAIDGLPGVLKQESLTGREAGDRVVIAWYWIGGKTIAKDWQAKAYGLYRKLLGADGPAALVALSAAYEGHPKDAIPDIEAVLTQHKQIDAYLHALAPEAD